MAYYPIKSALENENLDLAKRLARITANPEMELGLALKEAKVNVTFDDPESPCARWGQVIAVKSPLTIRVSHVGTGSPFEVKGVKSHG